VPVVNLVINSADAFDHISAFDRNAATLHITRAAAWLSRMSNKE
jgi:hypothetical protein